MATIEHEERPFLPAAGRHWALPFYDPLVKLIGGDAFRRRLVERADLRAGQRVLDVGCGTGTLAVLLKELHPHVEVEALDPDPEALARAERKAERAGAAVSYRRGYADALPYDDGSFAHVFSSYMFHHLPPDTKTGMLREVRRVLAPGGKLHLVDFAPANILGLMRQAGLTDPRETGRRWTLFGPIAYFQASGGGER
jgi:ubiquinone/menaquinone biosynthesis C-methylase UbiE